MAENGEDDGGRGDEPEPEEKHDGVGLLFPATHPHQGQSLEGGEAEKAEAEHEAKEPDLAGGPARSGRPRGGAPEAGVADRGEPLAHVGRPEGAGPDAQDDVQEGREAQEDNKDTDHRLLPRCVGVVVRPAGAMHRRLRSKDSRVNLGTATAPCQSKALEAGPGRTGSRAAPRGPRPLPRDDAARTDVVSGPSIG